MERGRKVEELLSLLLPWWLQDGYLPIVDRLNVPDAETS